MRSSNKFSQRGTSRDLCPSTCTRVKRPLKRVARAGCPDDNDAVATLPDNWTPRHSGPILANYLKQREQDHKTLLDDIATGAAAVNEDINKRVRALTENLLTHVQESQRNIDCTVDHCDEDESPLSEESRDKALKMVRTIMEERFAFMADFKQDALLLERERADKLRMLLRGQFQRLVAVGHRTPKDLMHEFDERIYDINQQLLSNSKAYTELEADLRGLSGEGITRARSSLNQLCLGIGMPIRGRSALIWCKDQNVSRRRSHSAMPRFSAGDPPGLIIFDHIKELNAIISPLVEAYRNAVLKMFSGFSSKLTELEKDLGNQDLRGPNTVSKIEISDLDRKLERQFQRLTNALSENPNKSLFEMTGADVITMQDSVRSLGECLRETCSILNHAGHLWDAHILRSALAQKLTIAAVEDLLTSHDTIELANEIPFNIALEQLRCSPDADKLQQQFDAILVLLDKTATMYLQHSEAELGRLEEFMNVPASMANTLLAEFDVFLEKYPIAPIQVLGSTTNLSVAGTPQRNHGLPTSVQLPLPRAVFQTKLQEIALMNWRNGFLESFKNNISMLPEELKHQAQLWVEQRSAALHMRYSLKLVSYTIRLERVKAARDARLAELRYHDMRLESHLGAISMLVDRLPEEASEFAALDSPLFYPFCEGIERMKVNIDNIVIENSLNPEVKKLKMKSYSPRLAKHRQLFEESLDLAIVEYKKLLEHRLHEARISNLENVQLLDKYNLRNPSKGTLYFATTHLIFVDHEMRKETWILLMHISTVERLPITTTGSPLLVRTKTFQSVFFVIPRERDCHEMHQTLLRLSQPVHIDELYCFFYKSTPDDLPKSAGWNFFDIQTEYQRMNVPNDQWVLCNANKDYELCDTYPSEVYVPARASTAVLLGSASFRSRGRLPVLAYLHHNKAAIARCSQPLSGFSARCMEDEQMLDLIRRANPNCGYMYVVDTRPRINAMVNRAAGKGYENEAFYENIKFQFMGIGNIHVMRKSLQKLVETCEQNTPTMSSFLNGLESSGWLKHIKSILDTSWWIASAIESGVSVCVHCSDGWDRTAQVCSLAALCLEPHYRTINGYQALIEKDWLSFGHKFTARCGHIACDGRERSPVFTQLLDCTWQLLRQRPEAFQFNERFLLTLHDHAHACQYGTFIGNCEKDRRDLRLSERTFSLWGYMASHLNEYKNPLYNPKSHPDVLKPDLGAQSIRFWRGMYCRHENGVHPRESLADLLPAAVEHCSALEHHINYLTKRITTFKNLLSGKRADKSKDTTVVNYQNGNVNSVEIETKTEALQIDNKLLYESGGTLTELECANHDHPLKETGAPNKIPLITEKASDSIPANYALLEKEVNTVALDWKSIKNVTECSCSTPLDHFSRKHHCWGCGRCVCTRCVCARAALAALHAPRAAPLCASCSPDTPDAEHEIVTPAN